MQTHFRYGRHTRALVIVAALLIAGPEPTAWGAPPRKREPVKDGLEKVGNLFFRIARKLEQDDLTRSSREVEIIYDARAGSKSRSDDVTVRRVEGGGTTLSPGYRFEDTPGATARPYPRNEPALPPGYRPRGEEFAPPVFQPHPQGLGDGRSRLSLPGNASPSSRAGAGRHPFEPPATGEPRKKAEPQKTDEASQVDDQARVKPQAAAPAGEPAFAKPVRGRPGFVYPPGAEEDLASMIDVRGFDPGQKVRDPRTGQVFLVPPK